MAANKSLTQICLELGSVASEAMSDVASQHSSGSGSGSGTTSAAPSVHEAMQEAVAMPLPTETALPFEDPVPQPLEGEALPRPITPIASPLQPSGVTQRRSSKAQAVDAWPGSPRAWPEKPSTEIAKKTDAPASPVRDPAAVESDTALPDGENNKNKQLVTYCLIPALAFAATYFGGPLIAPGLFENKLTGQQDTKKTIMAATLAACGAVLTARCVL